MNNSEKFIKFLESLTTKDNKSLVESIKQGFNVIMESDLDAAEEIVITSTYDVTTPESAEMGDFEDTGWEDEEGERFINVEDAAEFIVNNDGIEPSEYPSDDARWWTTQGDEDYSTGAVKRVSYHISAPKDVKRAVNKQIQKLLGR